MADRKTAQKGAQTSGNRTTASRKRSNAFTDEERAAMRERAQELKAARGRLHLLSARLHRGSFLGRESLGRLIDRGGAVGGLLCHPLLSPP